MKIKTGLIYSLMAVSVLFPGDMVYAASKCFVCAKTVYPTEQIKVSNHDFHKECFKCSVCEKMLNISAYRLVNKQLYCLADAPRPAPRDKSNIAVKSITPVATKSETAATITSETTARSQPATQTAEDIQ